MTRVYQKYLRFNEGTLHPIRFSQSLCRIIMGDSTWRFKTHSVFKAHSRLNRPSGQEQIWMMKFQISHLANGRDQLVQTSWLQPFTFIAWVNLSSKPASQDDLLKSTWQTLRFNKFHPIPCSSSFWEDPFALSLGIPGMILSWKRNRHNTQMLANSAETTRSFQQPPDLAQRNWGWGVVFLLQFLLIY